MNSNENTIENSSKRNILDYLLVLLKWRRFIISVTIATTTIALIISLLLPKWFIASASILPPRQADIFGSLSGASSSLKGIAGIAKLGGLGQKSGAYNYMAILQSRSSMEAVIQKFNLIEVYDAPDHSLEKTIKMLEENVSFEEQKEDYISIEVEDKDPVRAADMANYFVTILNSISIQLGTREARTNREFVEQRLLEANQKLHSNEEILRKYQEKSGMIIAPDENSSISAFASLYAMKAQKEIEIGIAGKNLAPDNPQFIELKIELSEIEKKLQTFPQIGLESIRLFRDVVIQQKIVEFLIPLYEQAKVDEQKDIPAVLVLDKAVPPERKAKPKKTIIVIVAMFVSLLFSIMIVFMRERIAMMAQTHPNQIEMIRSMVPILFLSKNRKRE